MTTLPTDIRDRYRHALAVANAMHQRQSAKVQAALRDADDWEHRIRTEQAIRYGAIVETLEWCLNPNNRGLVAHMLNAAEWDKKNSP